MYLTMRVVYWVNVSECWSGGRGILIKIVSVLQYCVLFIMVHKDTSSSYRLVNYYRALILLSLAVLSSKRLCVFGLQGAI